MRKCFRFHIVLYIILLSIIVSCNKDKKNTIHIEGRVYDPNTAAYVQGAEVSFAASKLSSGGVFSSGYEVIATTVTDALGTFVFDFVNDKYAGFQIRISKPQYFGLFKDISTSEIVPEITFSPTYNIYPVAYIDLKIRNAMPFDTSDFISYYFSSGWLGGYDCCDNTIMQGHGADFTDTVLCKTHGNQNVTLTYNVTKEGTTLLHTTTLYCPAFDTTYFIINY
ncbi:MAG TPA: carboxypeptidase-like regulatory domain-containing protein [Bacteroidales bacterium]|nr:carboxypeptidase-like regulatory domain-containing protein [Bacteroidales bacterium]